MMKLQNSNLLAFGLFILALPFFLFGCKDDDVDPPESNTPSYILEESVFGCSSYQLVTPDVDFQINHVHDFGEFLIYGGFDNLMISDANSGEILLNEPIGVNEFLEKNSKLMICSKEGIYELDLDMNLTKRSDIGCSDMLDYSDGTLLLTLNSTNQLPFNIIYEWDDTQGLLAYSNPHQAPDCVNLGYLAEASNGDIWGLNCNAELLRFRNKEFLNYFSRDSIPLISDYNDGIFIEPYGDDMIVVGKNGIGTYQVLKYQNNDWIVLFDISGTNSNNTDQDIEMIKPSIVETMIRNDKLYVATTVASCRGIHVFDITKNELLSPDDYYVVQDTELEGQCINDIFEAANGDIIVVTLGNDVTVMNCN